MNQDTAFIGECKGRISDTDLHALELLRSQLLEQLTKCGFVRDLVLIWYMTAVPMKEGSTSQIVVTPILFKNLLRRKNRKTAKVIDFINSRSLFITLFPDHLEVTFSVPSDPLKHAWIVSNPSDCVKKIVSILERRYKRSEDSTT